MTAATSGALQLKGQQSHTTGLLLQLFNTVNHHFFDNRIQAEVRWEIPAGSVSVFTGIERQRQTESRSVDQDFAQAIALLERNNHRDALPLLIRCADAGHRDGHRVLNHLLLRLNDERWPLYVKRYNQQLFAQQSVPAACYYPETRIIAIHPFLRERKAPQFVLKYLLFHECCHQLVDSDPATPHPPAFMALERQAPGRRRALQWLEKEGFPTLSLSVNAP